MDLPKRLPSLDERYGYWRNGPKITVRAKTLMGGMHQVASFIRQPICEVKQQLQSVIGVPAKSMQLVWNNKELMDYLTLEMYGIKRDVEVILLVSIEGGPLTTADHELMVEMADALDMMEELQLSDDIFDNDELNEDEETPSELPARFYTAEDVKELMDERERVLKKVEGIREQMRISKQKKKGFGAFKKANETVVSDVCQQPCTSSTFDREKEYESRSIKFPYKEYSTGHGNSYSKSKTSFKLPLIETKIRRPACNFCKKRIGICNTYKCRCGFDFCSVHRYPESHECSYDFKGLAEGSSHLQVPKLPKL